MSSAWYASVDGRVGRARFAAFMLAGSIVWTAELILVPPSALPLWAQVSILGVTITALTIGFYVHLFARLKDIGRSRARFLLLAVPVANVFLVYELLCKPSLPRDVGAGPIPATGSGSGSQGLESE